MSLGGSVAVTSFAQGVAEVAATTDGTQVAVAWVQGTGDAAEIRVREFSGGSWTQLANASSNAGPSRTPSLAYLDGALFAAWQDQTSGREEIYVQRYSAGAWNDTQPNSDGGTGVSATTGRAFSPKLVAGGGRLYLVWGDDSVQQRPDNSVAFYVKGYVNGLGFVEQLAGRCVESRRQPDARHRQLALGGGGCVGPAVHRVERRTQRIAADLRRRQPERGQRACSRPTARTRSRTSSTTTISASATSSTSKPAARPASRSAATTAA